INHSAVFTKETPVEGMVQGINLLSGCITVKRGHEEAKKSYHLEDTQGSVLGALTVARGPLLAAAGTSGAIANGILGFSSSAKAASLAGVINNNFLVNSAGYGGFFTLLALPAAHALYEASSTLYHLKKKIKEGNEQAGVEF